MDRTSLGFHTWMKTHTPDDDKWGPKPLSSGNCGSKIYMDLNFRRDLLPYLLKRVKHNDHRWISD